jgi:hypothetical protein
MKTLTILCALVIASNGLSIIDINFERIDDCSECKRIFEELKSRITTSRPDAQTLYTIFTVSTYQFNH